MKLITDRASNGLQSNEFSQFLLTSVPKTEITVKEADELEQILKDGLNKYPGYICNSIGY